VLLEQRETILAIRAGRDVEALLFEEDDMRTQSVDFVVNPEDLIAHCMRLFHSFSRRYGRICSHFLGPMPLTLMMCDKSWKGPCSFRYATITSAVLGPTPGRRARAAASA